MFQRIAHTQHDKRKKKKKWRCRGSIPVPLACKASALPFELHPPDIILLIFTVFQRIAHTRHDKGKKKKKWRCRGSIPVPLACKASALPFELHPPDIITLSFTVFQRIAHTQHDKREKKKKWRCRGSIPVPLACKASALPFELHPPDIILVIFTVFQRIAHTQHDNGKKKKKWRCRASIPVPLACKASALPFELHPPDIITLSFTVFQEIAHTQHDKGEKKKNWRCRASIPVPLACKASALPFELHPPDIITFSFTVFQEIAHTQHNKGEKKKNWRCRASIPVPLAC